MNRLKSKNGITLIALIITIIILLILAMVTIRILMNQGIIKHAQNATAAYNDAQSNETEYLTYAEGEMDKYAGASGRGSDTEDKDLDLLKKYFLGVNEGGSVGEGIDISEIAEMENYGGYLPSKFKTNAIISEEKNTPQYLGTICQTNIGESYMYIRYENKAYRVTASADIMNGKLVDTTKSVELVYVPKGEEGSRKEYTVTVEGEAFTLEGVALYDNDKTLELIIPESLGKYDLQNSNNTATGDNDVDQAIDSYNNAIIRLNQYCREVLQDNTARCVGSSHTNPDTDTTEYYSSTRTDNWNINYNNKAKLADNNAEQDFVRMLYHGVSLNKEIWLASRFIYERPDSVFFGLIGVVEGVGMGRIGTWAVAPAGAGLGMASSRDVLACVTVNK